VNKKVLSLDLETDRKSLMRTVCGSEFQTDGAKNRKFCASRIDRRLQKYRYTSRWWVDPLAVYRTGATCSSRFQWSWSWACVSEHAFNVVGGRPHLSHDLL